MNKNNSKKMLKIDLSPPFLKLKVDNLPSARSSINSVWYDAKWIIIIDSML